MTLSHLTSSVNSTGGGGGGGVVERQRKQLSWFIAENPKCSLQPIAWPRKCERGMSRPRPTTGSSGGVGKTTRQQSSWVRNMCQESSSGTRRTLAEARDEAFFCSNATPVSFGTAVQCRKLSIHCASIPATEPVSNNACMLRQFRRAREHHGRKPTSRYWICPPQLNSSLVHIDHSVS